MSTATLEAPVSAKASPFPAKARLEKALAEHKRAQADLEEYRGSAAKAELNEQQALNDGKLSEEQAAERITRAQNLRGVYKSRITNREAKLTEMLKELAAVTEEAAKELRGLTHEEMQRRCKIIKERICETIEVDPEKLHPQLLNSLLQLSPLIHAVRDCEPQDNAWVRTGSAMDRAAELLIKFGRALALRGKEI